MKKLSAAAIVILLGAGAVVYLVSNNERSGSRVVAAENGQEIEKTPESAEDRIAVETVKPAQGGIKRTTTQPASIEAFLRARLFSKVSGYMKMTRDIGEPVKQNEIVALIDMPELVKEVQRDRAAVAQAKAQVEQADAAVETTEADYEAARALIGERKADLERAEYYLEYRRKQNTRIQRLVKEKAVEEKLGDEEQEHYDAARAAVSSAKAAVVSTEAQANAANARITKAKADLVDAKAKVEVAGAMLEKDQVFLDYATIRAPFDGVITARNFQVGDFINSRDQGATEPMLAIDKTDVMRIVVQVPDRDAPYADQGDEVTIVIDSMPGKKFLGKISRVAQSEDPDTRNMRVEVDMQNEDRLLRDGMYGYATIILDQGSPSSDALRVPSDSVHVAADGGGGGRKKGAQGHEKATSKFYLWVVRGGKAEKVGVQVGAENGIVTEVLSGLRPDDEVVVHSKRALTNGVSVAATAGG